VSLSATARVTGHFGNTVAREVSSRLWAGSVLGRRSDHNARAVINDVVRRGRVVGCPLIATDDFDYYPGAVECVLGSACVYGQVLKTRRNNRVIRVERRNLTIRQASAYLRRRSPCHARGVDQLRRHVELVRCHYNFVRPHSALRFGRETRTPAMQAGLVTTRLALSDIFTTGRVTLRVCVTVVVPGTAQLPRLSWRHGHPAMHRLELCGACRRIRRDRRWDCDE
jgi:IS1 family transposase